MHCEFFEDGNFIDDCDQTNIPRVSDKVVIDGFRYAVLAVIWNYDTRDIRIEVRKDNG